MEFQKITITVPKNMVVQSKRLIETGMFANFSDLVRTGIRNEIINMNQMNEEWLDEKYIYSDKKFMAEAKKSMKDDKAGKGRIFKSKEEMREYLNKLK